MMQGRMAGTQVHTVQSPGGTPRLSLSLISVPEAATPAQSLLTVRCEIWGSDPAAV
jgi:hypothetical protein